MTMAALAPSPLTLAISAEVSSASLAGAGFSPLGPLLRTCPWILAKAASAASETPGDWLLVSVLGALQAAASRSRIRVTSPRGRIGRFIGSSDRERYRPAACRGGPC